MRNYRDPRDAIYAFLGMSFDTASIVPNYQKPVGTGFIEATQHLIRSMSSLDIVCTAIRDIPQDQILMEAEMPS